MSFTKSGAPKVKTQSILAMERTFQTFENVADDITERDVTLHMRKRKQISENVGT